MAELWGGTNTTVKRVSGVPGMLFIRATTVQSGDTLTIPCKEIITSVLHDETTLGGARGVKGTGSNINRLTVTCTNDDNINFHVAIQR